MEKRIERERERLEEESEKEVNCRKTGTWLRFTGQGSRFLHWCATSSENYSTSIEQAITVCTAVIPDLALPIVPGTLKKMSKRKSNRNVTEHRG